MTVRPRISTQAWDRKQDDSDRAGTSMHARMAEVAAHAEATRQTFVRAVKDREAVEAEVDLLLQDIERRQSHIPEHSAELESERSGAVGLSLKVGDLEGRLGLLRATVGPDTPRPDWARARETFPALAVGGDGAGPAPRPPAEPLGGSAALAATVRARARAV